jgi:hypothetical protein
MCSMLHIQNRIRAADYPQRGKSQLRKTMDGESYAKRVTTNLSSVLELSFSQRAGENLQRGVKISFSQRDRKDFRGLW